VGKFCCSARRPQDFQDQRRGPAIMRLLRDSFGRSHLTHVIVKELGERALPTCLRPG
jgi:hypothetical protein